MPANRFIVATFNANSIRSRISNIKAWLRDNEPDVLCVQETKVQDVEFPVDDVRSTGYNVVFRGQKAHAGVAIISKEEPQDVAYGIDDGEEPDEPRLIRAVIHGIPIVNTYVPQGTAIDSDRFAYKLHWFERLEKFFVRHYAPDKPLLWCGDFNVAPEPIDVHDPKRLASHVDFHPLAREALAKVKEWGWVDVFRLHCPDPGQYTYWDYRIKTSLAHNLGWRVDHIWATPPLAKKSTRAWIDVDARHAERPSDHTFLAAEFKL